MANAAGRLVGQTWDITHQQWVALCDPNDPEGEAERDAAALWTRDAKIFCCFGLGLGYFPAALARRLEPHQRLAIFDPNPMHYVAAMHAIDMAPLHSDRPVNIFVGDALLPAMEQWWLGLQAHEKFYIAMPMRSGFTQHCDAAVYDALLTKTGEMLRYHAVGLATWKQFGPCIGDSDLGNLPEYLLTPGLEHLQGLWAGKPALCLAAGPSLLKNVALLADPALRDKVAVLTAGTIYALVRQLGIQPDVVTTIDFQRLNWTDQFRGVPLDDAPALVYLHSTHPSTARRWPGPRFVALNASDTTAWLSQYAEPKAAAAQVQTVAHLNLVVAHLLGANPILLVGQDLSMPADAHHALGARAQDTAPQEAPDSHLEAEAFDGTKVWTRHSLLSMKTVFEQLIAAMPDRTVLNCSEAGLALAGAANQPLRAVLAALPDGPEDRLAPRLAACARAYVPQARLDDLSRDLELLETSLARLRQTADDLQTHAAAWHATPDPATYQALMACDAVLGQEGLAFGQIAVRRFEVIETLAAIPPVPETTEAALQCLNVQRLAVVAQAILAEAAAVARALRHTRRRLDDVRLALKPNGVPPPTALLWRALARESFPAVAAILRQWPALEPRLHVQLAWHQQRYAAAQLLADLWQSAPAVARRSARAAQQHDRMTQALVRPYVAALGPVEEAGTN